MLRKLFFILASAIWALSADPALAATHTVIVKDHVYVPANLTISTGDTVHWVLQNDFHNMVSGTVSGGNLNDNGIFRSAILNTGETFDVTFDRNMLRASPVSSDLYNYYCEPHAFMSMTGSVQVQRHAENFGATLTSYQSVSTSNSSATGSCSFTLDAQETQLAVNCTNNVSGIQSIQLRQASLGQTGGVFCTLPTSNSFSTTCSINSNSADSLFAGDFYVQVNSNSYPGGELRGQVFRSGGSQNISGKVLTGGGQPVAGVSVSDGTRSATTSATGSYTISNVPNGIYLLNASKDGFSINADSMVNPAFVNDIDLFNRSFTAGATPLNSGPDSDGDGITNTIEQADGSNLNDPGSFKTHLSSPIQLLWNGFLNMTNIVEVVNRSQTAMPVTLSLFNVAGVRVHQFTFAVSAAGQQDIILNDLPGFQSNSYGVVTLEFDSAFNDAIDGRLFFYRPGATSDYEFVFGVPFVAPNYGPAAVTFNTFQPSTNPSETSNVVAQWLSIANLAASAKTFTLYRYAQDGSLLSQNSISIPALGRSDFEAGHVSPGPSNVGLLKIVPGDNSAPYISALLRYGGNTAPGLVPNRYFFAFPLLARAGNGEVQRAPISTGAGATNWVEVANAADQAANVTLEFFSNAGALLNTLNVQLAAHAQQHFNAGALLASGASGSVRVTPSIPNSVIGQSMFYFRDPTNGSITAMYGSSLRQTFGDKIYGSYNLYLSMNNWMKLTNTRDTNTEVTLTVYRTGASPNVRVIDLSANQGIDLGLHEFSNYGTKADSYGLIQIETPQSGAVFSELLRLRSLPNGLIDFAAPTAVR